MVPSICSRLLLAHHLRRHHLVAALLTPCAAAACLHQVAFRPSTRQTHTDKLELFTGPSSITVPLSAVLPASKLQLPPALDFGCVPVRKSCVQQLPIKNVGDAGLQFSWKVQEPFAVVPANGQLAPGQTLVCEVRRGRAAQHAPACTATSSCTPA